MRPFTIELPQYTIRFALPEEMAQEMSAQQVEKSFDPSRPGSIPVTGYVLAVSAHDFAGPFWAGAYGSLSFQMAVQQKMPGYDEDITTLDGLERYVRSWHQAAVRNPQQWVISRSVLNGAPAVLRESNAFGQPGNTEPTHKQIYSLPLDQTHFIDFGIEILQWQAGVGKEKKWKPKAEAFRDAIKASITMTPRSPSPH